MTVREALDARKQVFVVCDRNVEAFARMLGDYPLITLHASEQTKTIETVTGICRWLMDNGADRDALLVAVGGGITTDIAGFAAAIYKRGIDYANIPTTLLGMVDAGLGGKTGVNLDSYKNMLGCFRQPEFTWLFPDVLRSLPKAEFVSGAAEMLKTFIICNEKQGYERTVTMLSKYAAGGDSPANSSEGLKELGELIGIASGIKQDIVNKDPLERGERRKLNLGHTWAHAIEWWQSGPDCTLTQPLTHGQAVAIGIVQAARRGEAEGISQKGLAARLEKDFAECGLPTELPCSEQELEPAIKRDKKNDGDQIRFVVPVKIGKVAVYLFSAASTALK